MEEKLIMSLYVSADEVNKTVGVYDGIHDVSEAVEAYKNLTGGTNPSIGIKIHKWGSNASSDMMIDIVSCAVIHLESLEYIPDIMRNETVYSYIAEIIVCLPDIQISGSVPEEVKCLKEKYAMSHMQLKEEKRNLLIKKLDNLIAEALKAEAQSKNQNERAYSQALLKYALKQQDLVRQGADAIDLQKLPSKEEYLEDTVIKNDINVRNHDKKDSLLGKLHKYQQLINGMTKDEEG